MIQNQNTPSSKKHKTELSDFLKRLEARNASAIKIMTRMHNQRDKLYEKYADTVIDVVGDKKTDMANILKFIKRSNNNANIKMSNKIDSYRS